METDKYNWRDLSARIVVDINDIQLPASRRTDPATSHQAEQTINRNGSRARQQEVAAELVNRYPNHTASELARYGVLTERQLSRRLGEAAAANMIERGPARICSASGHRAATWHPKNTGVLQRVLL